MLPNNHKHITTDEKDSQSDSLDSKNKNMHASSLYIFLQLNNSLLLCLEMRDEHKTLVVILFFLAA